MTDLSIQEVETRHDVRVFRARRGYYYAWRRGKLSFLSLDYPTLESMADALEAIRGKT